MWKISRPPFAKVVGTIWPIIDLSVALVDSSCGLGKIGTIVASLRPPITRSGGKPIALRFKSDRSRSWFQRQHRFVAEEVGGHSPPSINRSISSVPPVPDVDRART
jgi:hypothetical protein